MARYVLWPHLATKPNGPLPTNWHRAGASGSVNQELYGSGSNELLLITSRQASQTQDRTRVWDVFFGFSSSQREGNLRSRRRGSGPASVRHRYFWRGGRRAPARHWIPRFF